MQKKDEERSKLSISIRRTPSPDTPQTFGTYNLYLTFDEPLTAVPDFVSFTDWVITDSREPITYRTEFNHWYFTDDTKKTVKSNDFDTQSNWVPSSNAYSVNATVHFHGTTASQTPLTFKSIPVSISD